MFQFVLPFLHGVENLKIRQSFYIKYKVLLAMIKIIKSMGQQIKWDFYFIRRSFSIHKLCQININLTDIMKQNRKKYIQSIEDPQQFNEELYDPFSKQASNLLKKNNKLNRNGQGLKCCVTLFEDEEQDLSAYEVDDTNQLFDETQSQVELHVMKQINNVYRQAAEQALSKLSAECKIRIQMGGDSIINKIIAKNKSSHKKVEVNKAPKAYMDENFGFNANFRVAYPQTPGFKTLLHSPFGKFNSLFKDTITALLKQNQNESRVNISEPVSLNANPCQFYNSTKMTFDTGRYFIGISIKLRQMGAANEALYFHCLACYADPYNSQTWRKYIAQLQQQGRLSKACALAKTGFLFTQNQQLIKSFLTNGEKCGLELQKIQGIMCSISNPEAFEKTLLPQFARLQMKNEKSWKGVKILWQICRVNEYKLPVCINTLFLARYLENIGYEDKGMYLLKQSFSKSMSKLQIYLQYLEMSIRKHNCLLESELQDILKFIDYISGENRYKLLLEIAIIFYNNNDQRFYTYIANAYRAAYQYCSPGAGCNKAIKQIYYTIAKLKKILPKIKQPYSDNTVFQLNRRKFVNGESLIQHQFEDWKYYLHYGVIKRYDILGMATKKFPLTGRIIAQWIHCLRTFKKPLEMLKFWRQKIDQVPKSGQLWCEGGRIYVQLGQYNNAEKCFRCAMHFTPQYGDSFIEQLSLLMKDSRFLEIERLKKLFLVSEPFYGHVLSFLKLHHWQNRSLSLKQVWQNAVYQISQDLYKQGYRLNKQQLTAFPPYNTAYLYQSSAGDREKLFVSYEQMENKN